MVRPPPPPGPPSGGKPPPPKSRPPPPPPPKHAAPGPPKRPPPPPSAPSAAVKRKDPSAAIESSPKRQRRSSKVSIRAPVVMRDVDVFEKQHQVGEGTYGSVFVAKDKKSGEIVALKRINTEQEENGFPITALREVKILKALTHVNIVTLKEIVTSKGAFTSSLVSCCLLCVGKFDMCNPCLPPPIGGL